MAGWRWVARYQLWLIGSGSDVSVQIVLGIVHQEFTLVRRNMVKQSVSHMRKFLASQHYGRPQAFAALLLLALLAECLWLVGHIPASAVSENEFARVQEGLEQWHGRGIAGTPSAPSAAPAEWLRRSSYDPDHPPLWYLIESAPVFVFGATPNSAAWIWRTRMPYVLFGALLGASVWYVSRRLYGNAGGYIALALYCFSPAVIRASTLWFSQSNIAGPWGTFGGVFTAIAVSHTLYAPREVVLWNWRRILLLGVSLALAAGSQFALMIIVPVLLLFMLYLAPERKLAAIAILAAACGIAIFLLFAAYFFHPGLFLQGLRHAKLLVASGHALTMTGAYLQMINEVAASGPVLILLAPFALIIYFLWQRSRYFGNTAPLLVALLFLALRVAAPHDPESIFSLAGVVFLFVFIAGIAADLRETKSQELVTAVLTGLLAANAIWNLVGLTRIAR